MIRRGKAARRAFGGGLLIAAVASAGAAAAVPSYSLSLHARLVPVAGGTAAGRFSGTLLLNANGESKLAPPSSVLRWKVRSTGLHGRMSTSLRLGALNGAAPATRMLCARCAATASGRVTLTRAQALRISRSDATVVVSTSSGTLRGPVKVSFSAAG